MSNFLYSERFYGNPVIRPMILLSVKISHLFDMAKDKKICGMSLVRFVPTPYAETHGATGSQSTPYWGLEKLFKDVEFRGSDHLIDVGCGKGRVLAYLAGMNCAADITGVELNPEVAMTAKQWTKRYSNINVIEGNAFDLDYDTYNKMFMFRPMETGAFIDFITKVEGDMTHPLTLYYYADQQSSYYLNIRPGWSLMSRAEIIAGHGFFIHPEPQRYSIWVFDPDNR